MNQKPDTRQQILNTASILFHSNNYSDIGVARVCQEAGVSKGSFFHFFPTKQDLVLAVVDQAGQAMAEQLVRDVFRRETPPMDRFDKLVEGFYQQAKKEKQIYGNVLGCPFGNLIMEQGARDEKLRVKTNSVMKSISRQFQESLADAAQFGDHPELLDVEATAVAMLSYLEGLLLMAKSRNDPEVILNLGQAIKLIQILKHN